MSEENVAARAEANRRNAIAPSQAEQAENQAIINDWNKQLEQKRKEAEKSVIEQELQRRNEEIAAKAGFVTPTDALRLKEELEEKFDKKVKELEEKHAKEIEKAYKERATGRFSAKTEAPPVDEGKERFKKIAPELAQYLN